MERLTEITAIVFDKTGTLTLEQPHVVNIYSDLRQLDALFALGRELQKNIAFNFSVATAFSLLSGGSILFLHLKFVVVELLAATQLLTGVGIASKPLLAQTAAEVTTPAARAASAS